MKKFDFKTFDFKKINFKISVSLIVKLIAGIMFFLILLTAYNHGKESGFGFDIFVKRDYEYKELASERVISSPVEDITVNWHGGDITVKYKVGAVTRVMEYPSSEIDETNMMDITLEGTELIINWNEEGASASKEFGKKLVIEIPAGIELDSLAVNGGDSNITVEKINSDYISLKSGLGLIDINSLKADEAIIRTSEGNITAVSSNFEYLSAESTEGDIILNNMNVYTLSLFSARGETEFTGDFHSISAKSYSGNITAETSYKPGDMDISSTAGNIKLTLPSNTDAIGTYKTVKGEFNCDFMLFEEYPGVLALGNVEIETEEEKEEEEEKDEKEEKRKKEEDKNEIYLSASSGNISLKMGDKAKSNLYFKELLEDD